MPTAPADRHTVLADFPFLPDTTISSIRGGRRAALIALTAVDPAQYTRSRNFLDGAVSRLSPYLRHGVLTLAEVRDHILDRHLRPNETEKFINELAWRDFWQRLYTVLGAGIWTDREPYKTGFDRASYKPDLPANLLSGTTGLLCMDSFSADLQQTGYLHNHARMWMAAYLVHWLHIRWQTGARWFLEHLLDGDPASNNLSWQWVASTFSNKPYFFNRENLERYTNSLYCQTCSLRANCPLDATYEDLESTLFRISPEPNQPPDATPLRTHPPGRQPSLPGTRPLLWIHTDSLNPESILFSQHPDAPACFVWDEAWLREDAISSKRVVFLNECLAEMPPAVTIRRGDLVRQILTAASDARADHILAQRSPDPRLLAAAATISLTLPVLWVDPPAFADNSQSYELKRFSRYWKRAQPSATRPTR